MAPECMTEGLFHPASDVWAYGVLLWEIFSWGALPYPKLGNEQVFYEVLRGMRLMPPDDAPPIVAELMRSCWKIATGRPSFPHIHTQLLDLQREDDSGVVAHSEHTDDQDPRRMSERSAESVC